MERLKSELETFYHAIKVIGCSITFIAFNLFMWFLFITAIMYSFDKFFG